MYLVSPPLYSVEGIRTDDLSFSLQLARGTVTPHRQTFLWGSFIPALFLSDCQKSGSYKFVDMTVAWKLA